MIRDLPNGRSQIASIVQLEWKDAPSHFLLPEPTLELTKADVQGLAHGLLESGDLPREFLSNDRELSALKEHLKDSKEIRDRLLRMVEVTA